MGEKCPSGRQVSKWPKHFAVYKPLNGRGSAVRERCCSAFSLTNRRKCGHTHCQPCSSRTVALPHLAIAEPVRVCDGCFAKLREKKVQPALPVQASGRHDGHDADMDRALALSLQPNQQHQVHQQQQPSPRAPKTIAISLPLLQRLYVTWRCRIRQTTILRRPGTSVVYSTRRCRVCVSSASYRQQCRGAVGA
ncbi:hypothetical protein BC940DRAFT_72072 [Gongronella butleri]|nr:hypothetical protein BC940DRAFT_72072 [Gongronella butleri]